MPTALNRDAATPLYVQLSDLLREKIERGDWKPDQKIPSENELNQTYGISRMTARQVLARLVDEGLLFRVQGKGTFVAHRKISTRLPSYMGIREQLEQKGYATRTELLSQGLIEAEARVARELNVTEGSAVYMVKRLRLVEDSPISLHESYVPQELAPGMIDHDLVQRQLCAVLETEYGLRMIHVHETLESTIPSRQELKALRARPNTPLLLLEQRISSESRMPFEFSRIFFRGDKVRLEFHYDR